MVVTSRMPSSRILQTFIYRSILTRTHKLLVAEAKTRLAEKLTDIDKACPGCGGHQITTAGKCHNCKRRRKMLGQVDEFAHFNEPFYVEAAECLNLMLNHAGKGLRVIAKPGDMSAANPIPMNSYMFLLFEDDCISKQVLKWDFHHEVDIDDKMVDRMAEDLFEYLKKLADAPVVTAPPFA